MLRSVLSQPAAGVAAQDAQKRCQFREVGERLEAWGGFRAAEKIQIEEIFPGPGAPGPRFEEENYKLCCAKAVAAPAAIPNNITAAKSLTAVRQEIVRPSMRSG